MMKAFLTHHKTSFDGGFTDAIASQYSFVYWCIIVCLIEPYLTSYSVFSLPEPKAHRSLRLIGELVGYS